MSAHHLTIDEPRPRFAFATIALLILIVGGFILWASQAELEEITRGQGRVVPSSKEQVIQSLDPGILTAMLVHEGDKVEKGQLLLRLDDTRSSSLYRELQAKTVALAASASRLRAEAYGTRLEFPPEVRRNDGVRRREIEAYEARKRALEQSLEGLKKGIDLLDREIRITEPMVGRGLVSEVELLRLKRQRNDLAVQITDRRNKFSADAAADLTKVESELAQARETLPARADAFRRTEIRSPMKGTVKSIRVSTIGGVVQAGQEIMQIVPSEDTLVIEAYVRPADVAFLHPGQSAVVKLSAYDYAIYGGLDGVVENISPDTLRDERRAGGPANEVANDETSFYRVLVRTRRTSLHTPAGEDLPIIPGMTATVEMLTGRKTVMQYLIKPINRAAEAMRER